MLDRCSGIVDGLLDFSRPKSRAKAAVSLNAVVTDALSLLKHHQRFKRRRHRIGRNHPQIRR